MLLCHEAAFVAMYT